MKAGAFKSSKVIFFLVIFVCLAILVGAAGAVKTNSRSSPEIAEKDGHVNTEQAGGSKVYFTADISSNGVLAVYRALGTPVSGKVAVKVHFGEPGNTNFARPELLRGLVENVKGTFVDSNIIMSSGRRGSTATHQQVAREHGFTYAPVDILDSGGEVRLPVRNGNNLSEAVLGANIMNYDWIISVAHFKGHSLAGFGGTFKNLAVGIATPAGKRVLHDSSGSNLFVGRGEPFIEKVVEYNMALNTAKPGKLLYINILNNLSVDCDCISRASKSTIQDIGILASLDPVALEKASVDLIYARPENERKALVERIESRKGIHQVEYAEKKGLGSQTYELIRL